MSGHKIDRISGDVHRELTDIMRSVKDPRVNRSLLSIVRVDVTNDLSYATVYVCAMDGIDAAKKAVVGLKSASGFIRRELGSRLKLRKVPELRFVADDSIERSANIARMLDDITSDSSRE
jgi:ribosome-binding factor A